MSAIGLVVVAGAATALYSLHVTSKAADTFAREFLVRLRSAQDLLVHAGKLHWQAQQMAEAESSSHVLQFHLQMQKELDLLDLATARLAAGNDVSVPELQVASQALRNAADFMAQVRGPHAPGASGEALRAPALVRSRAALQLQAQAIVLAAHKHCEVVTASYRDATMNAVAASEKTTMFVVGWVGMSLASAWAMAHVLLGRSSGARRPSASRDLRLARVDDVRGMEVPMHGKDGTHDLEPAVERFLRDSSIAIT